MKNMKKFLALALVAMTVLAVAIPAMAAYRPWQYEWSAHTLLPGTFPPEGSELRTQIRNFQSSLNAHRQSMPPFTDIMSPYYFSQLVVDGKYGNDTATAVSRFQSYYTLQVDGKAGVETKNKLWNLLGRLPVAD